MNVNLKGAWLVAQAAEVHPFLARDDAAYITGQVIFVVGGLSVGS